MASAIITILVANVGINVHSVFKCIQLSSICNVLNGLEIRKNSNLFALNIHAIQNNVACI